MKATIYHNPRCGTSRKTLAILKETPGVELTVVEYLKEPPTKTRLKQLIKDGDLGVSALRVKGSPAEELGLTAKTKVDDEMLTAMVEQPILINRPIVETEKGVRLCRPCETVHEIL